MIRAFCECVLVIEINAKVTTQNVLCYCSKLRFITQKTDIGQSRALHPTTLKWRITVSKQTERETRKHRWVETDGEMKR